MGRLWLLGVIGYLIGDAALTDSLLKVAYCEHLTGGAQVRSRRLGLFKS